MSLYEQVATGKPGLTIEYFRGYLPISKKYQPNLCADANAAVNMAIDGRVLLTQKRLGFLSYSYRATIARTRGQYWVAVNWPVTGYNHGSKAEENARANARAQTERKRDIASRLKDIGL